MEAIYNFSAMEIGDCVFFIADDYGVKYGRIVKLHYYKCKDKEGTRYELAALNSEDVITKHTSWHVFKSADEALAYLEYLDKKQRPILSNNDETV